MRILITGGRSWSDYHTIYEAIVRQFYSFAGTPTKDDPVIVSEEDLKKVTIVHGGAKGADSIAEDVAYMLGVKSEVHPANWAEHHRAAGPIRNQKMVDLGADVCLAFLMPGSKGTADCIKRAEKAGIPVIVYKGDTNGTD